MEYKHKVSILVAILLSAIIVMLLASGRPTLFDLSTILIAPLLSVIFVVLWWGFRQSIEGNPDFFSPVHVMIETLNKDFARENVLRLTAGAWIDRSKIHWEEVSEAFSKNTVKGKFTDDDFQMWLSIEKEITQRKGFWLGSDRQRWFDELERRFNR